MSKINYLLLFLIGLGVTSGAAVFQSSPGYMDAEYYYAGGLRLANGYGFSEMILWNYLDNPSGLPHPSHTYWMPLVSILAAIGMKSTGAMQFSAARVGFLVLCGAIPCLTAALSYSLTQQRRLAILGGLLAIFPAYYLPFLPTTDAFSPYMMLGASFFLLIYFGRNTAILQGLLISFLMGLTAGLMHLTRADGLIWLFLAIFVVSFKQSSTIHNLRWRLINIIFCLLGYLIIMGPWMLRNLSNFGTLLAPGGMLSIWFTNYDELFIYPASLLTPLNWWQSGLQNILQARLWAFGQNLQTTIAVQGEIFLAPLILLGLWHYRKEYLVRLAILAWSITFIIMTGVFPFAGARGGLFHSGAALQPLLWAVAPVGLDQSIAWAGKSRRWNILQARRVFQVSLIGLAIVVSFFLLYNRVIGREPGHPAWSRGNTHYVQLEQTLIALGALPDQVVVVNDAPGYYIANGRPAISIPYGDLQTLMAVAERYRASYLLLEINQILGGDDIYSNPGDRPGLRYLGDAGGTRIFAFAER